MSSFLGVEGGVEAVRAAATRMQMLADALSGEGSALAARISAGEAGAPWGADETGTQFFKNYSPGNEQVKAALGSAGTGLADIASAVASAMGSFGEVDHSSAAALTRVAEHTSDAGGSGGSTPPPGGVSRH